jgi:hypothetical protein
MIEGPKVGSIWRHTQRAIDYEVVSNRCNLQCATAPEFETMFEDDYFVVYKSVRTGSLNVRPVPEFMDGRFVWVKDAD